MPNTTYGTPYAQSSDLVSNWPGVSLNVADRLDDVSFKGNGLNDQTGTTYTLVLTDAGKTVTLNNASAVTVTVPTNASVAYETGTCVYFTNKGAGVVTISPAGGVTLNNSSTLAQYASCYIQKLDTNTWVMVTAPAAGLTLITSSTFSSVASVSVNNCFTSTYDNYRAILTFTALSADMSIRMRLRAAGADNSGANYDSQLLQQSATTVLGQQNAGTSGATQFALFGTCGSAQPTATHWTLDIISPQLTAYTKMNGAGLIYSTTGGTFSAISANLFNLTTSFDGFSLLTSTGTMSGTVRVYGYRNS